mmetsp:Transcript_24412/g.39333  ORF Transcript_24412/g.39333 Transcript_24412/m.39333 type:complete len:143 (-) Transcript_24412:287-715(-)
MEPPSEPMDAVLCIGTSCGSDGSSIEFNDDDDNDNDDADDDDGSIRFHKCMACGTCCEYALAIEVTVDGRGGNDIDGMLIALRMTGVSEPVDDDVEYGSGSGGSGGGGGGGAMVPSATDGVANANDSECDCGAKKSDGVFEG